MPTILSAAGIEPPRDRSLDGVNLMPLLIEEKPLAARRVFWGHGNATAMRDGPGKLLVGGAAEKPPKLYNLADDLAEENAVAEQHPDRVEQMTAAIAAWQKAVAKDAPMQPTSPQTP